MQPAFLAPFAAPLRRPARRTQAPSCCATGPRTDGQSPAAAGGRSVQQSASELHESWRVYEKDGNACVICSGTGKCKCLYCFGDGVVFIGPERRRDETTCPQCEGRACETCPRCRGSGIRPSTRMDPLTGDLVPNRTNKEVREGVDKPVANAGGASEAPVGVEGKEESAAGAAAQLG